MTEQLTNLLNLFQDTLYIPIFDSLNESAFAYPIIVFIQDFINGVLNMFGNNQNEIKIVFDNDTVASIFTVLIFYLIMKLLIKIFISVSKTFIKGFKNLFNQEEKQKKGWRKQWKRKKA